MAMKTLDELLGDKETLCVEVFAHACGRVEAIGVEVLGVRVEDVSLPGEMHGIIQRCRAAPHSSQGLCNVCTLSIGAPDFNSSICPRTCFATNGSIGICFCTNMLS